MNNADAATPDQLSIHLSSIPKNRGKSSKPSDPWTGYENELATLKELAIAFRDADKILGELGQSGTIDPLTSLIRAIANPEAPNVVEARTAADAQRKLKAYHEFLMKEHGFDFHVIRREWAVILNPIESERIRCDRNIATLKIKN